MSLIVRTNYGDESIALLQWLAENPHNYKRIIAVYINTGWAASTWAERVHQGEAFAQQCGFETLQLHSKQTFAEMVKERGSFPSAKFQWCAGFLKGLPLLEWLDEHDPSCEWTIAIPKRQALYRQLLTETITECSYHGERQVWHPLININNLQRDLLLAKADFAPLNMPSLECAPCIHSTQTLQPSDQIRLLALEKAIKTTLAKPMVITAERDNFSRGCGDYFGCGL